MADEPHVDCRPDRPVHDRNSCHSNEPKLQAAASPVKAP